MNLREKLQRLKEQQQAANPEPETTPEPAEEAAEEPVPTAALPGAAIKEKLKALGARKEINPPAPAAVEVRTTETAPTEEPGDVCPTCGKAFKVLAKHRCKETPAPIPNIELKGAAKLVQRAKPAAEELGETEVDGHNYILLIDCVERENFVYAPADSAYDICKPVMDAICKENDVEHWKLIPYGGGAALLQARFERFWNTQSFHGAIVLSSSSLEYASILPALMADADRTFQGIR